jgi:hypothetical protein
LFCNRQLGPVSGVAKRQLTRWLFEGHTASDRLRTGHTRFRWLLLGQSRVGLRHRDDSQCGKKNLAESTG